MTQRVKALADAARKLTPEERVELMAVLSAAIEVDDASVDGAPAEIAAAWDDEVARRIDQVQSGEMKLVASDEMVARARQRIATARTKNEPT